MVLLVSLAYVLVWSYVVLYHFFYYGFILRVFTFSVLVISTGWFRMGALLLPCLYGWINRNMTETLTQKHPCLWRITNMSLSTVLNYCCLSVLQVGVYSIPGLLMTKRLPLVENLQPVQCELLSYKPVLQGASHLKFLPSVVVREVCYSL